VKNWIELKKKTINPRGEKNLVLALHLNDGIVYMVEKNRTGWESGIKQLTIKIHRSGPM
jgi:hypothetical protein